MFFQTKLGTSLLWAAIYGTGAALACFLLTGLFVMSTDATPGQVWEAAISANAAMIIFCHIVGFFKGRRRFQSRQ